MLSLFPQLFDWSFYVPLIFRVFLALYLFSTGFGFIRKHQDAGREKHIVWGLAAVLIALLGVALFTGVYIQLAGMITFIISMVALYFKRRKALFAPDSAKFYLLFGLVALSLVFLGPGAYALDLPL